MQGVKTASDNGWEDRWLDYTVSCQCNAANKIKNLREIFVPPYLEYPRIFVSCSQERITLEWYIFMTKWSESILYGAAVYKGRMKELDVVGLLLIKLL